MIWKKRIIIGIFCLTMILGLTGIGLWYGHFKLARLDPSEELFVKNLKVKLAGKPLPRVKVTNRDISKCLYKKYEDEVPVIFFGLPHIYNRFEKEYRTSDYTDQLRIDLITYISLKAKQLGEDPEEVKRCWESAYGSVSQEWGRSEGIGVQPNYPEELKKRLESAWADVDQKWKELDGMMVMLPCYAEKVRNKTNPCWLFVCNWEILNIGYTLSENWNYLPQIIDIPLCHVKIFAVDVKSGQVVGYSSCE